MVKVKDFTITFDDNVTTFLPGDDISGCVKFNLSKSLKIRGIRIYFKGRSFVQFNSTNTQYGGNRRSIQVECKNQKVYFDLAVTLFGNEEGTILNNPTLAPGAQSHRFTFRLPPQLPHSFEGGSGKGDTKVQAHIRYTVCAKIDVPFGSNYETEAHPIRVESTYDINREPDIARPSHGTHQELQTDWCCASAATEVAVILPQRSGFMPGEDVIINIQIANSNVNKIRGWVVQLVRICTFYGKDPREKTETTQEEQVFAELKSSAQIMRGEDFDGSVTVKIPDCSPSVFANCDFITARYEIRLKVKPSGSNPFSVSAPVKIGSRKFPYVPPPPPRPAPPDVAGSSSAPLRPFSPPGSGSKPARPLSRPSPPRPLSPPDYQSCVTPSAPLEFDSLGPDVSSASTSFNPSTAPFAPSLAQPSASYMWSPSSSANDSIAECAICMTNVKDVAFDCGHLACSMCAEKLSLCHICRDPINEKKKIFL